MNVVEGVVRAIPAPAAGRPSCEIHPLSIGGREVQSLLRRRQRDVHHREVEHDHQLRDPDYSEDQPAAPTAGNGGGGSHCACALNRVHWLDGHAGITLSSTLTSQDAAAAGSLRTSSTTAPAVSARAQSRCSSPPSGTQVTG